MSDIARKARLGRTNALFFIATCARASMGAERDPSRYFAPVTFVSCRHKRTLRLVAA
jgi:hypothetical protein